MWEKITCFFDEFLIFIQEAWNAFIGSFAVVVESIPVPDFMVNVGGLIIPDSVLYFAAAFNITAGITIIVAAYGVRFLIRRIPVIG